MGRPRAISLPASAVLWLGALALAACAPAPRALEWTFSATEAARVDEVVAWEASIRRGGCPGELPARDDDAGVAARDAATIDDAAVDDAAIDDAAIVDPDAGTGGGDDDAGIDGADAALDGGGDPPIWQTRFVASERGASEAPPHLPPGTYALVVLGRDAACRPVLAGCREIDLPRPAGVRVEVALTRADGPACEECVASVCRDPRAPGYRTCEDAEEIGLACEDRIDGDCDRAVDCLDADCAGGPACPCAGDADCGECERCDSIDGECVAAGELGACEDGAGACVGGACCTGCVGAGTCEDGTTTEACGVAGEACVACPCTALDACVDGACVPEGSVAIVAAGDRYGCAIDDAGALFCWGDGTSGRLGNGTVDDREMPTRVACPGGDPCTWLAVATGHTHTCAILRDDEAIERLLCWGANESGQLGAGSASSTRPQYVGGGLGNGMHRPIAVDVGESFTCAIVEIGLVPPGRILCWGLASEGRLGLGPAPGTMRPPTEVVVAGADFATIALGRAHACALTTDARTFCWGSNARGQVGVGLAAGAVIDAPRALVAAMWRSVAAGGDHTCATLVPTMATTERVRCWGANDAGELGLGHRTDRDLPAQLSLAARPTWALSAGLRHTCVLEDEATTADDAYCFGENADGRVAAMAADPTMPIRLVGDWLGIAAGGDHTCAIGRAGDLWCQGANDEGQLGRARGPAEPASRTCL